MEKGNGPIYIDQRDIPRQHAAFKVKSWHQRRKFIRNLEIDPHDNRIEIVIGSHFCMGGIRVNKEMATTLPGLFAAGEVMGGVHGGLRLAGYSFTQMIVFGLLAGQHAALYARDHPSFSELPYRDIHKERERVFQFLATKKDALSLAEIKNTLQKIMADQVFVLRDRKGLEAAISSIQGIRGDIQRVSAPNFRRFNLVWMRSIEFGIMAEMAEVIARSALARQESRGFHFRKDFPEQDDDNWLKHTVARRRGDRPDITSEPVALRHLRPEAIHE
jgi:succinate dehydrogenase/fumarate reductase flavoprotein subunit